MDVVAAEFGVRLTIAIVERDAELGQLAIALSTSSSGNRMRSPLASVLQPVIEETLAQLRAREFSIPISAMIFLDSSRNAMDEILIRAFGVWGASLRRIRAPRLPCEAKKFAPVRLSLPREAWKRDRRSRVLPGEGFRVVVFDTRPVVLPPVGDPLFAIVRTQHVYPALADERHIAERTSASRSRGDSP